MHEVAIAALALGTAAFGALGGLGGAVLLVPLLVLFGEPPTDAAPLGLFSVAAGSLAAGGRQLQERTVHHRIGVVTETMASSGAVIGALIAGAVSERTLTLTLAAVAVAAAVGGGWRRGMRNPAREGYVEADIGEWPGSLAGAYGFGGGVAPYQARRLPVGLTAMTASGLVAGLAGTSGGFIKTPATSELMHVPVKVAASTTTFTIGITSASALLVFLFQGRIDPDTAAPVIAASLVGGRFGAALQARLAPTLVRRALSALLVAVGLALVVR